MYYEDDGNKFGEGKTYRETKEKHYNYNEDGKNNFRKNSRYYDDDENDENNFGKSTTYKKEMYYDEDDENNFRMTYGKKMYYDENDENNVGKSTSYRKGKEIYYDEDDVGERRGPYYYDEENDYESKFGKGRGTYYDDEDDKEENDGVGRGTYYDDEKDEKDGGLKFGEGRGTYYDDEEEDDYGSKFGKGRRTYYYDDDYGSKFGKGSGTYYDDEEEDDGSKFGERKEMYYDDDGYDDGDNFGKSTTNHRRKIYYDNDEDDESNFEENSSNHKGKEIWYEYDENNGNKFGERIPYREGKGTQLVKYENGEIILIKESLEIIQNIEEPVAIISVVGSYRRGKSYFANVLHGRHDGFELGSKVDSCTKGIFMWDTPFFYNGFRVIVLDCEGIDDPKQDEVWATKLFILCLAISSTFVYNIHGIVGRDDIGKLYAMTDLSKFLLKSEDDEKDYLPRLVVLLRDFALEVPDNFKDYFLERLAQVDSDVADGITNHFEDFDVYALPHPGCKKKLLHELEKIETSQLDPDFISQMSHAVSEIYDNISPKKISSKPMTGISFSKFLQDCIQHMNATTKTLNTLSLSTQYTSLVNFMSKLAIDVGFTYYSNTMTTKSIHDFPLGWNAFEDEHALTLSKAYFLFDEKLIENHSRTSDTRIEFENLIEGEKRNFAEKNSETLKNYNLNLANSIWRDRVEPGLTADYLFKNDGEFDKALDKFMQEYTIKSYNGPEAMEVYEQFKDQKMKSTQGTLDKMFEIRDAIKSTKESHQELIDQINRSKERLEQLLDENNREENEHKKQVEELVSAIDNLNLKLKLS